MYYLAAFWVLFMLFVVFYIITNIFKIKKFQQIIEEYGFLFIMGLGSLVIVAIASKDPIVVAGIEIPVELQWFASLFVTIFGAWRFFLNPLKKKVYRMDREIGEVKVNLNNIGTRIDKVEKTTEKIWEHLVKS